MTKLDRITHEDNKVYIRLYARSASKYSSLERTALKHFANWQSSNYTLLGYKSSVILETKSEPADDTHFFYTLVIGLMYPKTKPEPKIDHWAGQLPPNKLLSFSSPAGQHNALLKLERRDSSWTANVYRGGGLFFEGDRLFGDPDEALHEIELDFYDWIT